ncbi:Retrovirus-related Pol polyprotein from transposon TNT 1-94 [Artemisia annua]|uniref:Retrovirus-related Pol polyprotein from transposon TNT 1-94 n=1 Tax=Artemisia annua TaxID=35608 RepID=A0A2U1QHG3_ARTAN|nr:Retrovirus-related Pol polyprotein from transposon TNT 1-94 [Artemisia annua]
MDEAFKYQDLTLRLLGSLPEEYELLETTLLNGKDDVSLSEVCATLYSKELKRKDKHISSTGDAEVFLVRGHSRKKGTDKIWRSKSRQRLSKDECAFCHEKRSLEERLSKVENQGQSLQRSLEANVTKCDDEESYFSLATSSTKNASDVWLLDSACSHYIKLHREWFSNFEEHEEVVYTVDETLLITHGIGSVRLQNQDGTIVALKGVCYPPKLKKNLISVGTLESKGFEVRAKDGVMKIISGVLVVMKDDRETFDDSPIIKGDYEEEEVQTEEPPQQNMNQLLPSSQKETPKGMKYILDLSILIIKLCKKRFRFIPFRSKPPCFPTTPKKGQGRPSRKKEAKNGETGTQKESTIRALTNTHGTAIQATKRHFDRSLQKPSLKHQYTAKRGTCKQRKKKLVHQKPTQDKKTKKLTKPVRIKNDQNYSTGSARGFSALC